MRKARNIAIAFLIIFASIFTDIAPSFATTSGSWASGNAVGHGNYTWYAGGSPYTGPFAANVSIIDSPAYGYFGAAGVFSASISYPTASPSLSSAYTTQGIQLRWECKRAAGTYYSARSANMSSNGANNPVTDATDSGSSLTCNATAGDGFDHVEVWDLGGSHDTGERWYPVGHPSYVAPTVIAPVVTAGECRLTDTQLVQVARAGGFTDAVNTRVAVAVAIAESAGKVNALHGNGTVGAYTSFDIGLWQINDVAHPSYNRVTLGVNPTYNATAAFDIYTALTPDAFTPWVTYNSGAYLRYMDRAALAITNAPAGSLSLTDCSGGTSGITDPDDIPEGSESDSETQCTGWNPFTYIKCALRWAFVPPPGTLDGWQDSIATISDGPPLNWIISGFSFCNAFIDGVTADEATPSATLTQMTTPDGQHIDFLAGARDASQESDRYSWFFAAQVIAVWGGAGWMMLNMVNRRFGGKE